MTTQVISYKGNIKSAKEKISGKELQVEKTNGESKVSIVIPPGDLAIVDIIL